ncbi:MAG: hypothetical protein Q4G69_01165 [Planctomycetia bacterium]|nr:hypothetical protein [Planctomycetia bacterium]
MNRFYFYKNAKRVGPINSAQLRKLAMAGLINRDTVIETDTGRQVKASRVYGLAFKSESNGTMPASLSSPGTPAAASPVAVVSLGPQDVITFSAAENAVPLFSSPSAQSGKDHARISPVQKNTRKSFVFNRPNPQSVFDTDPDQNAADSSEQQNMFSPRSNSSKGVIVVK